jgi:tRNA threonylcarbamoyladenosine biosynthesis protein TsaB
LPADLAIGSRAILAIDTCGRRPGVALIAGGRTRESEPDEPGARAENVAKVVDRLLREAGLEVGELSGLAVTVGPGSYTGVRVGLALMRGLALVDSLPIVGIGSLELLALAASGPSDGRYCALLDAASESLYAAVYDRAGDEVAEVLAPRLVERAALSEFLRETAAGATALRCESEREIDLDAGALAIAVVAPRARRLAEFASTRLGSGSEQRADEVMPLYVGASHARPNRDKVVLPPAGRE